MHAMRAGQIPFPIRRGLSSIRLVLPALLLGSCLAGPALAEDSPKVQRYLAGLKLGDTLDDVRAALPPRREWTITRGRAGRLTWVQLERTDAKNLPGEAGLLRLGLSARRLVYVQVVYDREASRRKPLHALVADYALVYGEPRRRGQAYLWTDDDTVLRASEAEVLTEPTLAGRRGEASPVALAPASQGLDPASQPMRAAEFRTSLELMDGRFYR